MQKPLKILIVADTLDIDASSGAKTSMAIIESIAKMKGIAFKVLHYSRKEVTNTLFETHSIPEKKIQLAYFLSKMCLLIQRMTGVNLNYNTEARKGFSYTHYYDVKSIKNAIKKENPNTYDWILALSYAGSFRAHKAILELPEWHSKFLPYIHDPYPQASYPRPYDWVEPGHQPKRDFFVALYKVAAYILYPSKLLGEWMESYYHGGKGKMIVVPHQMPQVELTSKIPGFMKPEAFTILHAGSLMSARNPMALAYAFCELVNENQIFAQDAQLIFVGKDSIFHEDLRKLSSNCSQLYIHQGYLSFDQVLPMQYSTAVNVIIEAKAAFSPFLPGKVPHCIKANRPILLLGPNVSETKRLLGEDYPYWAEIDEKDKIKKHLSDLYIKWKEQPNFFYWESHALTEYFSIDYFENQIKNLKASKK